MMPRVVTQSIAGSRTSSESYPVHPHTFLIYRSVRFSVDGAHLFIAFEMVRQGVDRVGHDEDVGRVGQREGDPVRVSGGE